MVDTPSGSRPVSPSASRSARVNAVPRFSSDDTSTDEPRSRTRATTPSGVETRSYGRSAITSPTQLRPATGCRKEPTVAWPSRAIGRGRSPAGPASVADPALRSSVRSEDMARAVYALTAVSLIPVAEATWVSGRSAKYRSTTTSRCRGGRVHSAEMKADRSTSMLASPGPLGTSGRWARRARAGARACPLPRAAAARPGSGRRPTGAGKTARARCRAASARRRARPRTSPARSPPPRPDPAPAARRS